MFSKGASPGENNSTKVFTEMYDSSFEDFSSKDLSQLDTWVFDKVEQFFEKAASDPDLQMKLRQDKIVLVILVSPNFQSDVLVKKYTSQGEEALRTPSLTPKNVPDRLVYPFIFLITLKNTKLIQFIAKIKKDSTKTNPDFLIEIFYWVNILTVSTYNNAFSKEISY